MGGKQSTDSLHFKSTFIERVIRRSLSRRVHGTDPNSRKLRLIQLGEVSDGWKCHRQAQSKKRKSNGADTPYRDGSASPTPFQNAQVNIGLAICLRSSTLAGILGRKRRFQLNYL